MYNIKKKIPVLILIILITHLSCKKTYNLPETDIVINEVLPVNISVVPDQSGQYDDWIEIFNLSSVSKDISGYLLSDKKTNPDKWKFPQGTFLPGNGYLIIWADADTTQPGLHANFKLSSLGENILISEPDGTLIDKVTYPPQTLELSYSRNPNGTGEFKWQNPTYNRSNSNP